MSLLSFAERDKIRRGCRRKMLPETATMVVQTYRVWITLECGHRTSFTMSGDFFKKHPHDWTKPRKECYDCSKIAEAAAEAIKRQEEEN